jgi:hypothetical protein
MNYSQIIDDEIKYLNTIHYGKKYKLYGFNLASNTKNRKHDQLNSGFMKQLYVYENMLKNNI